MSNIKSSSNTSKTKNNNSTEKAKQNTKYTIFIVVFLFLFIGLGVPVIIGFIFAKTHAKQIKANWPEYRCKPYIIPLAGTVGPPGTDTTKNFSECMSSMFSQSVNKMQQPTNSSIGKITYILTHFSSFDI